MKVLLIGSGGREQAIAENICLSPDDHELYCYGTNLNPGIDFLSENLHVGSITDNEKIKQYAQAHNIDFAVVGPEAPLASGLVDVLAKENIPSIGPTQSLARIESSKGFTRDFLKKFNIPGSPRYVRFNALNDIEKTLDAFNNEYVIKADGLMGGKGVLLSGEHLQTQADALKYCKEILDKKQTIVIEEKLQGQEFSLMSFSDGYNVVHMPVAQDHKRAYENDTGPNTGGMGSYTDTNHLLPFLSEADVDVAKRINEATIAALKEETGEDYCGILYGGFMLTADGVKLIEYNARFGDPESINILGILDSDFVTICQAMITRDLQKEMVNFTNEATVVKYAVPKGYPNNPVKNQIIDVNAVEHPENLYFAAIEDRDGDYIMTGSRAIAVLGIGETLAAAEKAAQDSISQIKGPVEYRKDIGTEALIQNRDRRERPA